MNNSYGDTLNFTLKAKEAAFKMMATILPGEREKKNHS